MDTTIWVLEIILFSDIFFPLNHLRTFSVQIKTTFTVGLIKLPLCTSCSCTVCILQPVGSCFCCVSFCRSSFVITGYMEDFALVLETSCVTMCHGALCGLIENRDKKCSKEKCNFLKTNKKKSNQVLWRCYFNLMTCFYKRV